MGLDGTELELSEDVSPYVSLPEALIKTMRTHTQCACKSDLYMLRFLYRFLTHTHKHTCLYPHDVIAWTRLH